MEWSNPDLHFSFSNVFFVIGTSFEWILLQGGHVRKYHVNTAYIESLEGDLWYTKKIEVGEVQDGNLVVATMWVASTLASHRKTG